MSAEALEKAIESYPDGKTIVIAHLYGTPGKIDEIRAIANKQGAVIIEGAAESLGAAYKGIQTGIFGDLGRYRLMEIRSLLGRPVDCSLLIPRKVRTRFADGPHKAGRMCRGTSTRRLVTTTG